MNIKKIIQFLYVQLTNLLKKLKQLLTFSIWNKQMWVCAHTLTTSLSV